LNRWTARSVAWAGLILMESLRPLASLNAAHAASPGRDA
jgi:hypothetical protein